ncbi:MAG TPA: polyprenyl diphosphate synthase [Spirochaetia bacterium]|nr:polyprenyl diphosphate synthase [Spirochaetia bacterium]
MSVTNRSILPRHIAFICDGNGRWANSRGMGRSDGHIAGLYQTQTVVEWCVDREIPNVSAFLWSTENWKRDSREVGGIMDAVVQYGPGFADRMHRQGVRLYHAGLRESIDDQVLKVIDDSMELTRNNTRANLCLAFNYGGKADILQAVAKAIADSDPATGICAEQVSQHLLTSPMPDIDYLIRTGNETRISNFMLWQAAYAELHFSEAFWPDFSEEELDRALLAFHDSATQRGIGENRTLSHAVA